MSREYRYALLPGVSASHERAAAQHGGVQQRNQQQMEEV